MCIESQPAGIDGLEVFTHVVRGLSIMHLAVASPVGAVVKAIVHGGRGDRDGFVQAGTGDHGGAVPRTEVTIGIVGKGVGRQEESECLLHCPQIKIITCVSALNEKPQIRSKYSLVKKTSPFSFMLRN